MDVLAISRDGGLWLIRAVATVVAATVTATRMICSGENHQAVVEIKVAGPDLWPGNPTLLGVVKLHDALATDARFVASLRRDTRDQFIRDANARTPARAFVGRGGAELAVIRAAAQRTTLGGVVRWRAGGIMAIVGHENQARLRRATMSAPRPRNASESVVGSGTATRPSISALPASTSMRTNSTLASRTLWPRPSCAHEMS